MNTLNDLIAEIFLAQAKLNSLVQSLAEECRARGLKVEDMQAKLTPKAEEKKG